jgi:hypothetical protein
MRKPRVGRPRRSTVAAAAVVLVFLLCGTVVVTGFYIETQLQPTDGHLGTPLYLKFPLCGRSYMLAAGQTATKAQIDAAMPAGFEPFVLEPTIGRIPLFDLVLKCPEYSTPGAHGSVTVFATVIWLHVAPDEYVGYSLEGGP